MECRPALALTRTNCHHHHTLRSPDSGLVKKNDTQTGVPVSKTRVKVNTHPSFAAVATHRKTWDVTVTCHSHNVSHTNQPLPAAATHHLVIHP
jgi:hypothetical protein